jgi:hypothetical protein
MSLRPEPIGPVPEETARVAHAAFPRGSPWLRLRDELGTIYTDETFAPLFPTHGRPAEAPWRVALVTVLQNSRLVQSLMRSAVSVGRNLAGRKDLAGAALPCPDHLRTCETARI